MKKNLPIHNFININIAYKSYIFRIIDINLIIYNIKVQFLKFERP